MAINPADSTVVVPVDSTMTVPRDSIVVRKIENPADSAAVKPDYMEPEPQADSVSIK